MNWSHLPVAGGVYDQDPFLLERWRYLMGRQAEYDEQKRNEEQKKSKSRRRR